MSSTGRADGSGHRGRGGYAESIPRIISQTRRVELREEPPAGATTELECRAGAEEPLMEAYDSLTVHQVTQRLRGLSVQEIERLRGYETRNKYRRSLMQRFDKDRGCAKVIATAKRAVRG